MILTIFQTLNVSNINVTKLILYILYRVQVKANVLVFRLNIADVVLSRTQSVL